MRSQRYEFIHRASGEVLATADGMTSDMHAQQVFETWCRARRLVLVDHYVRHVPLCELEG